MREQSVFLELERGQFNINIPASAIVANKREYSISMVVQSVSFDLNYDNIDATNNIFIFDGVEHQIPPGNYSVYDLVEIYKGAGVDCSYQENNNTILFDINTSVFRPINNSYLNLANGDYTGTFASGTIRMGKYESLYLISKGIPLMKNTYSNLVDSSKIAYSQIIARIPITNEPYATQTYKSESSDFQYDIIGNSLNGTISFELVDKNNNVVDVQSPLFINLRFLFSERINDNSEQIKRMDKTNDYLRSLFLMQGDAWESKNDTKNNNIDSENNVS